MIALMRKVAVCVCLGACTLMLPGCRAPGPPIMRHERLRPQKPRKIVKRRESVNQPNVPHDDAAPSPVEVEEPADAVGGRINRASRGRETVERNASEQAEPKHLRSGDGNDEATDALSKRPREEKSPGPGSETVSGSPVDERRDDGDPNELADRMPDQGEVDTVRREQANGGAVTPESPALFESALVPVIPARVEKTTSTAPGKIVYPEAPPPIEVSREQVDALRLPSTDPMRPIIGIWEQVDGDNSADFAEGNYTRTVLVFRTDGVLEVVRWFGSESEIRLDSKLNYTATVDSRVRLESPRGNSGASRQSYTVPLSDGMSVRVDPIQAQFPALLTFEQNSGELVIDGKTYRHVEPR